MPAASGRIVRQNDDITNGAAMAAFLAAAIGGCALGMFVLLNEAGLFSAPTLYGPAGGVSGRTVFGTIAWLLAWVLLHRRWNGSAVSARRIFPLTLLLIGVALLAMFPPLWEWF